MHTNGQVDNSHGTLPEFKEISQNNYNNNEEFIKEFSSAADEDLSPNTSSQNLKRTEKIIESILPEEAAKGRDDEKTFLK